MRIGDAWTRLSSRERALVVLGALVVIVGAAWPLGWQPIERDLALSTRELAQLHARTASLRKASDDIAVLKRSVKTPRTADPRAAVESAVSALGLRQALTSLDLADGRVRTTFAAVDFDALVALLNALGRDELLFVREATLVARMEPGSVRAELTLSRPDAR